MEEVRQRHNEIVELEKSISLLQEIFADMQNLVESQVYFRKENVIFSRMTPFIIINDVTF